MNAACFTLCGQTASASDTAVPFRGSLDAELQAAILHDLDAVKEEIRILDETSNRKISAVSVTSAGQYSDLADQV